MAVTIFFTKKNPKQLKVKIFAENQMIFPLPEITGQDYEV